jgi:RNA polymerase sigma-70 factor (ECF subfamily)
MRQEVALTRGTVVEKAIVQEKIDRLQPVAKDPNWSALLRRVAEGDHLALAELYDTTNSLVFGLALRILNERGAAEDVVVEVYTQVWTQAHTYDVQRGSLLSWLLTMTRSRAIDALRVRNRPQPREPLGDASDVPATTPDLESTIVAAERRHSVRRALESLSPDQRQVIELAYFSGLSHTEIAARLGQPLGTVKTRIRVGMMRLRELLSPLALQTVAVGKEGTQ